MMGFGLLFVILAVVALVYGLGWLRQEGRSPFPDDYRGNRKSPLDILQERYARGEISKAEYEEMRHELNA